MSSNNSSTSTSSNASSERIYDFEYMFKLATSSGSAMSSTSTLAQLNSDEDVAEIVKLSPTKSQFSEEGQDNTHDNYMWDGSSDVDSDSHSDSDDEDEYGSWYDIRTDLSDEQIEELRNAVYDAISLELPLSPVDDDVTLSFTAPEQQSQPQQSQQYPAPILQWQTTRAKSNFGFIPPVQFQSRAFATLATRRQSQFTQRQSHTHIGFKSNPTSFQPQRTTAANAFNTYSSSTTSNAFNWRREATKYPTRNNVPVRSNANVSTVSWRKTQPGLEWKYNEESNGYKLIKV